MFYDRKMNDKQLTDITAQLKQYAGSTAVAIFQELLEQRVIKLRLLNDTAPVEEIFGNQKAIQELLTLLKLLK